MWSAEDTGDSLENAIKLAARAKLTESPNGLLLVGSSINGKSFQFQVPGGANGGGLTPETLLDVCEEFIQLRVDMYAALTGTPTDAAVLAEMLDQLRPVRYFTHTFTGIRD